MTKTNAMRLTTEQAEQYRGCIVSGVHGVYAEPMVIRLAEECGLGLAAYYQRVTEMAEAGDEMEDRERDEYAWLLDFAEEWLNRFVAPEGWAFFWHDGDFMFDDGSDVEV